MAKQDEAAGQGRRNFLKAAGGTAIALVAAKNAGGQSGR